MKKNVFYILSIVTMMLVCYSSQNIIDIERLNFEDYIEELNNTYGEDKEKILDKINKEINNKNNSKENIGVNLLMKEYYFYTWKEKENLIKNFSETEKYLKENNMYYELLQLYAMMSSIYTGMEQYSTAYIYIYNGEKIAKNIYENNKNEENLSTLVAIKYLKAIVALDLGMKSEAEEVFNEAEELRTKKLKSRERVDIYLDIVLYYEELKEYKLVEEYAYKLIKLIEKNDPEYLIYKSTYIKAKVILANNYINTKNISQCIEIIEQLKEDDDSLRFNGSRYDMYNLYAHVYKYYGYSQEYLKYLKMAYNEVKDSQSNIRQFDVVECIISELKLLNNQEDLLEWYEIERTLIKETETTINTQYLLSQINDSDLQNANHSIEILQLQKSNMIYLILLLILITVIIFIFIFLDYKRKKLLKANINILKKNMDIQHKYYEDIKSHHENIKRVKHDIKNHLTVINQLIIEEEYESVRNYIKSVDNKIDYNMPEITTNNKIISAIIFNKIKICKAKNIEFDFDIKVPENIDIDDFDICVIFGNLLDNAIEACSGMNEDNNKYIKLKTGVKGNYLFINIKNSYSLDLKIKGNKFITNKKDKINHGIGIDNIRASIQKYDGNIKINHTDNEFNVSIILEIEE